MADGTIRIDTKIDKSGLKKDLKEIKSNMKATAGNLRDIWQGVIPTIKAVGKVLQTIGKITVGNAKAIEDMTASFTPLLGSVEKAKDLIKALNQEASTTPFTLNGIGSVAKQLLPAMNGDIEKTTQAFRMLGDTAGGSIEKLETITRGYMKTLLKGKVDMESLNMIAEAGVPIYTELSKSMGVTVKEMMKLSSEGKITSDDLTEAFKSMTTEGGIFFNGMEIASQTLSGKMSTLSDILTQIGATIGESFLPSLKEIIDKTIKTSKAFLDWINNAKKMAEITRKLKDGTAELEEKLFTVQNRLDKNGKSIADYESMLSRATNEKYRKKWREKIQALRDERVELQKLKGEINYDIKLRDERQQKIDEEIKAEKEKQRKKEEAQRLLEQEQLQLEINQKIAETRTYAELKALGGKLTAEQELLLVKQQQIITQEILDKKLQDGYINQSQYLDMLLSSYETLANTMYDLGVTADSSGTEQQKFLSEILGIIDNLKETIKNSGIENESEDMGENIVKSMARGLTETSYLVLASLKELTDKISEDLQNAGAGRIGSAVGSVLGVIGSIGAGIGLIASGDVAGGISSLASGIGGIVGIAQSIGEAFFEAIDFLVNFDSAESLQELDDTLKGLEGFFSETGELFKLSAFFESGAKMIADFVTGLMENKDVIFEEVNNVLDTLGSVFTDNTDIITDITEFVMGLITVIVENLPMLLEAGFEILKAIGEGIAENAEELSTAFFETIAKLIEIVSENLGDFIALALIIMMAISEGLIKNLPEIVNAIALMTPEIIKAIVENLPEIVKAFAKLIPLLILMSIEMFPTLIATWVELMGTMIETIVILIASIPELFVAVWEGLSEGAEEGIDSLIESIEDRIDDIVDLFSDIGTKIYDALTGALQPIIDLIETIMETDFTEIAGGVVSGDSNPIKKAGSSLVSGAKKLFGFATGSAYIEQDQVAEIHKGERIIPKTFNDSIMSGETMMMNSKSFSSILNGLNGGMSNPSLNGIKSNTIRLVANITGKVNVDGREIGRTAFQYTDEFAGASFGS